jgi:hypothetical protein
MNGNAIKFLVGFIVFYFLSVGAAFCKDDTPADTWKKLTQREKLLFIAGFQGGNLDGITRECTDIKIKLKINDNNFCADKYKFNAGDVEVMYNFIDKSYKVNKYKQVPFRILASFSYMGIKDNFSDEDIYKFIDYLYLENVKTNDKNTDELNDIRRLRERARDLMQ